METMDLLALVDEAAGCDDWLGLLEVDDDMTADALGSSPSNEDTLAAPTTKTAKKRPRTSLRNEVLHLRAKHDALTAQLDALTANASAMAAPSSIWADRAKDQAVAAQQALHENARLQELLRDQLKTIATIQRAFARKPKLCDFPCVASWKMATLGTTGRREAKAKLMQHQYNMLETEWIRHGLHDLAAAGENVRTRAMQSQDEVLCVHFAEHHRWEIVEYTSIADIVWALLTLQVTPQPPTVCDTEEVELESDVVYCRYVASMLPSALPPVNGRLLSQRFTEADRVVFVSRSIVDDALFPSDPSHFVDNQCCWIVVAQSGTHGAQLTSFARFTPPMVPATSSMPSNVTPGMYSEAILHILGQNSMSLASTITSVLEAQRYDNLTEAVDG